MNYHKIYNQLINKRKINILDKKICYCEKHHIIPKSLGGSNDSSNLVNLTAREHFIAHWLLFRIYKNSSMAYALKSMKSSNKNNAQYKNKYINSRAYNEARKFCSNLFSEKTKGRKETIETRNKKSIALKGRKPSEKTIQARKNMIMTDEYKNKLSISKTDKTLLTFKNKNGDIFIGTMIDFRNKYSLCRKYVSEICIGKRIVFKGWQEISRKKELSK